MKFSIKLEKIRSADRIDNYWQAADYRNLLQSMDYDDAESIPEDEVKEMLYMALSELEPEEAAEVVLRFKLGERLKASQINNLSHEMLDNPMGEEYPDISFHYPLFNINQLLLEAFNGKFPRSKASVIDLQLKLAGMLKVNKEVILRTLSDLLSPKSVLKRLFQEQLDADGELKDAESIIWQMETTGLDSYRIITSDYWIGREDFEREEYSGTLDEDEIEHLK
ncbi:hypothetical protein PP178_05240 [Zeaxanthinibacter sp. PT1]|uniref:hypothetical protein n=1 Tax=Zeaxanthinibacter TaxID=561554 RepID=UPI00234AFEBA|nr:hypothetical protein [Zeaxanthinibacter sp. PT1]MDC6350947.1 hypothetical protein [Zeaxanthinibacter sp. PT1]